MARRTRRPGLSPDDQDIWDRVTRSVAPMRPGKAAPEAPDAPDTIPKPKRRNTVSVSAPRMETAIPANQVTYDISADPLADMRAAPPKMDRRNYDRLRKGKLAPERRIDLHGMTVARAQTALRGFILRAWADDVRVVLVITGKGRAGPMDDIEAMPRRRGVIRQSLSHWVSTPPLSDAVLQIMPASQKHGGSGAFYVYLRRRR